jgi:uncharacterized membrane protein YkvA (DUF1232 family)
MDISLLSSKLEGFARRVGKSAARTPLLLYYVLQSKDTSLKDKAIIATCLAYVILPIDLIPTSKFSLLGWADEILSIEIVFDRMRKYITPEMNSKAEKQLNKWIPQNNSSVVSQIQSQGIIGSTLQQSQQQKIDKIKNKWNK